MTYFDADVLVHFFYNQDETKHIDSIELIEKCMSDNTFAVSWLNIQEAGFVLSKLKQSNQFITQKLNDLITFSPLTYDKSTFVRAIELANQIGFGDFNDCLHTAIAEKYCTELYTYNSRDFGRIQPLTTLTIHIL
jgi:predicted nucleic acid-binding protein